MKRIVLVAVILSLGYSADAQVLKNFGKRIERKIEERIDRKADRSVDKVLDKGDKKTDEPLDALLEGKVGNNKDSKEKSATKDKESKRVLLSTQVQEKPGELMVIAGGECSDFIWFKKGASLTYAIEDEKGKTIESQKMDVKDVHSSDAGLVANIHYSTKQTGEFDLTYKCVGDAVYMDYSGLMQQAMQKGAASSEDQAIMQEVADNTKLTIEKGNMGFPKKMHPGMKLDDLAFNFQTGTEQMQVSFNVDVFDRHVNRRETVKTPAGEFDCLVIISQSQVSMDVLGKERKMPSTLQLLWFSPKVGMVKQETYNDKQKLESKMELTAFSM